MASTEKKKELFPFFAYKYSIQMNPEKYRTETFEEWADLLEDSSEDVNTIIEAAANLTEDEWMDLERQYNESVQDEEPAEVQSAKKGAKMQYMKKLKSYKKGGSSKKCSCGCVMVEVKEKGGKMTSKCSCGCEVKEEGGKIPEKSDVANKVEKVKNSAMSGRIKKLRSAKKSMPKK